MGVHPAGRADIRPQTARLPDHQRGRDRQKQIRRPDPMGAVQDGGESVNRCKNCICFDPVHYWCAMGGAHEPNEKACEYYISDEGDDEGRE